MFDNVAVSPGEKPSAAVARQILAAFSLPADAIAVERVRRLFAQTARYGGILIETEAAQFLDRVRNTGWDLGECVALETQPPMADPLDVGAARPNWLMNYIPRRMTAGETRLANVRFENAGTAPMRHAGTNPYTLAVRWHDAAGTLVELEDCRTPLPIDLPPGRSLTLPVRLRVPDSPGSYTLTLLMVEEDVRWLDDDLLSVSVQVSTRVAPPTPAGWWIRDDGVQGYDADHDRGLDLLRSWVKAFAPPCPRILEIGGNAIPMIEQLEGDLYNIDVDLLGLQICSLRQQQARRRMTVVCADAANLPFPVEFFDVIVVFASLHHFPDPATVLADLRVRLKPGGFFAIMCEPVGHIWPGAVLPEYLRELNRGANEQSFTPEEYVHIFGRAELETLEAIVDKDSLKARLKPRSAA